MGKSDRAVRRAEAVASIQFVHALVDHVPLDLTETAHVSDHLGELPGGLWVAGMIVVPQFERRDPQPLGRVEHRGTSGWGGRHVAVEVHDERWQTLIGERVEDPPGGDGLALPGNAEDEHMRAARRADPPPHVGRVRVLPEVHVHDS